MKHKDIASRCPEYCSVAESQNFGISLLNNLDTIYYPDCRFCVNWNDGECDIFIFYRHGV